MRRGEGRGRAGIEAAPAGTAMVGLRIIRLESQAQINLPEEQPGAEIARYQIGVLALPAEPGVLGERLLHHRGRVDEELEPTRPALLDPVRECLKAALQGVVVVAPARIDRDDPLIGILE